MRFFASWWERFPVRVRKVTPSVVTLAIGLGLAARVGHFAHQLAGPTGFSWG